MSDQPSPVENLIHEGIEAYKSGDRALARGKLEAAVQIDQYNEKAWLALAQVVETAEEKRTCLGNVLLINPQNTRALQMLEKLEVRSRGTQPLKNVTDTLGGMAQGASSSPRALLMVVGSGVILLILCILLVFLLNDGGDEATPPTAAVLSTATPILSAAVTSDGTVENPTITPTREILPTWTPPPPPTDTPPPREFPQPPAGLTGRIILQTGRIAGDPTNQPIAVISAGGGALTLVTLDGQRGRTPALVAGQDRFAWVQYSSGTRSYSLQIQNFNAEIGTAITSFYGNEPALTDFYHPVWSGDRLVFSAKTFSDTSHSIWLVNAPANLSAGLLSGTPLAPVTSGQEQPTADPAQPTEAAPTPINNSLITRLVADGSDNLWPAFDPTGSALIYVSETAGITDLKAINMNTQLILPVTENGNALVESAPDWGSSSIVFSAVAEGSENSDIYIMPADASSEPTVLIDLGPNDIQPRFSPDSRMIIFSSDVNGDFDVFLYSLETQEVYGLVVQPNSIDIANDWTN